MDDKENISKAREGALVYSGKYTGAGEYPLNLDFIEKEGLYAYAEFFLVGRWPDKYYYQSYYQSEEQEDEEHPHLPAMYRGIRLKMVSGGWCKSLSDLVQTIHHHPFYPKLDTLEEQEAFGIEVEAVREVREDDWE